jgi:hypothetical protein
MRDHWARLVALESGTPVTVEWGRKLWHGEFAGVFPYAARTMVRVRVQSRDAGGLTYSLPIEESWRVRLGDTQEQLGARPSGHRAPDRHGFIKAALGPEAARSLLSEPSTDCTIIGRTGQLSEEFRLLRLGVRGPKSTLVGSLVDLARPRPLIVSDQVPRSLILSSSTGPAQGGDGTAPALVVFDGSQAFVRWRHCYDQSHWLVLLAKTESRLLEAAAILNSDYAARGREGVLDATGLVADRPRAVEAIAYVEAL